LSSERLDITIDLPQTAYQELGVIAKYADRLSNIRSKALEVGTVSSLMELSKRISDSTQIGQEDLMLLLRGLVNLNALLIKARAKPGQLVDLLTETIERDASPRWKEQYFKQWGEAKDLIATALDWIGIDEAFVGLRKLHLLTFAHQNILTDVKIINELRPVYNSNGDKILHTILTYSMLIDYSDGSRQRGWNSRWMPRMFATSNCNVSGRRKRPSSRRKPSSVCRGRLRWPETRRIVRKSDRTYRLELHGGLRSF